MKSTFLTWTELRNFDDLSRQSEKHSLYWTAFFFMDLASFFRVSTWSGKKTRPWGFPPNKNLTKRRNINMDQRLFTGNVAFYLAIPWMLQAPDTKKGAKIELRFIRVVTYILIIITYLLCLSSLSSILFLLALLYRMCMIFILIMCFKSNDLNFLIHWSLLLLTERRVEWSDLKK